MNIVKYAPQTHADRFFNEFWPWASFENSKTLTDQVKVNVVENEDNYTLTAEVPGLTEKDIDIHRMIITSKWRIYHVYLPSALIIS